MEIVVLVVEGDWRITFRRCIRDSRRLLCLSLCLRPFRLHYLIRVNPFGRLKSQSSTQCKEACRALSSHQTHSKDQFTNKKCNSLSKLRSNFPQIHSPDKYSKASSSRSDSMIDRVSPIIYCFIIKSVLCLSLNYGLKKYEGVNLARHPQS